MRGKQIKCIAKKNTKIKEIFENEKKCQGNLNKKHYLLFKKNKNKQTVLYGCNRAQTEKHCSDHGYDKNNFWQHCKVGGLINFDKKIRNDHKIDVHIVAFKI